MSKPTTPDDEKSNDSVDVENNKWKDIADKVNQQQVQDEATTATTAAEINKEVEPEQSTRLMDEKEMESLRNQIQLLESQMAGYKEKAIRIQAEMENLRRRTERDVSQAHKYGNEKIINELLPVLDSLQRGLEGVSLDDPALKSMRDGLEMTLGLLEKTLVKFGLKLIDPQVGEVFNPELHEAMSMQTDSDFKSNTIIQCFQRGYQLNQRVLRAAMVVVAK